MKMFKNVSFCSKCGLNDGDVDTVIDENGLCNICNGKSTRQYMSLYRDAKENCIQFEKDLEINKGKYSFDCILMLSGGKDSIYMLNRLVTNQKVRPLAYTFNHPFESKIASKNIENVLLKLNLEHFQYTPNTKIYKMIMKNAFKKKMSGGLSYGRRMKFPCLICTNYMRVSAIVFAYKMGIPYVLYCADPVQSVSFQSNSENLINDFIDSCGEELYNMLPEKETLDEMISGDKCKIPKMIFPYTTMNDYNAEQIIKELKNLGLYESSPRETHCSLHSLLNYYSIKNYNTLFYEPEMASLIRIGKLPRNITLSFLESYKNMVLNIATKKELLDQDKKQIRDILSKHYSMPEMSLQLEHEVKDFVSLRKIAEELELELSDV